MSEEVKFWKIVDGDRLKEINQGKLNLEERIENWLADDISIISNNYIVIGRQLATKFGGFIDLLCLDKNGDIVILELKRDKTPRDIIAQTLDYATWVKDLSNDRITDIANQYLEGKAPLEEAFKKKFGIELPESLNENHKMLIVASQIDSSTERIINYLSDEWGVPINAVTFKYFHEDTGTEYLARVFLIEPDQVEYSTQTKTASKRRNTLTFAELRETAEGNGVGELYRQAVDGLWNIFDDRGTTMSSIAFISTMGKNRNTIFSLTPGESDFDKGLRFVVYDERFAENFGMDKKAVMEILPANSQKYEPWKNAPSMLAGFFKDKKEIEKLLTGISSSKKK